MRELARRNTIVETLRGVLLASTVGLTLGTTTKLNWARWLPVCGCPHVLLLRLFENGNNHATNTLQASQHLSTQTPFRRASHFRGRKTGGGQLMNVAQFSKLIARITEALCLRECLLDESFRPLNWVTLFIASAQASLSS